MSHLALIFLAVTRKDVKIYRYTSDPYCWEMALGKRQNIHLSCIGSIRFANLKIRVQLLIIFWCKITGLKITVHHISFVQYTKLLLSAATQLQNSFKQRPSPTIIQPETNW